MSGGNGVDGFPADEEDQEREAPRRRVTGRDVAVWGARTTGGLVGVGIAAVVAIAAVLIVPPSWSRGAPSVVVTPDPAQQLLVCPGSLLRLADESGANAGVASAVDVPSVAFAAASGSPEQSALANSDAGTGGTAKAPQIARIDPSGGQSIAISGTQTSLLSKASGSLLGLATASCEQPSLRSWIVAGSTVLGRTSVLVLVNPTNVPATVDLTLHGAAGPIDAVGLRGIVVPAASQRVVPINGFSLDQATPVIGITSSGGNVAAFLQQSIIRTLTPGGVDVSGAQSPSRQLVIPGLRVLGDDALKPLIVSAADERDIVPTLRLFAPGAAGPTTATVALIPDGKTLADALANPDDPAGEVAGDAGVSTPTTPTARSFTVALSQGAVAEVPITSVAAGSYSVVVTADVPLVGAVRQSSTGTAGTDFAWFAPADALGEQAVVVAPGSAVSGAAVTPTSTPTPTAGATTSPTTSATTPTTAPAAGGLGSTLTIVNPGTTAASITLASSAGSVARTVPAGGAVTLALADGTRYALSGTAGLRAAVTSGTAGFLAQSPLLPPAGSAQPVTVRL